MTKLRITTKRDSYEKRPMRRSTLIVFATPNRPIENGDIIGDFKWRREHSAPYPTEMIKEAIQNYLHEKGLKIVRIAYSKMAGCSMCPCSPGYVVTVSPTYYGGKIALWLE